MAPHADRLADIGRDGFDLVNRFYGGGTSGQAPKKQYNVPQQHASHIGREGFDLVDRFYGGGTSGQAPKKQYSVQQLYDIGREGFDLVDIFYGGGTSGQAPKKQYNVPRQYTPVPSEENLIDSKTAAKKNKGMASTQYYKKFVGRRF